MNTVNTIKVKNKNDFYCSVRGYAKTVKCQGKIREKSGNFEVDDKWRPWLSYRGSSVSNNYLKLFMLRLPDSLRVSDIKKNI